MKIKNELLVLQNKLAQVDLLMTYKKSSNTNHMEILLIKLKNLKMKMYKESSHQMPHLHIDYNKQHHVASYNIKNGLKVEGSVDKKYDKEISNWIIMHKSLLMQIWLNLQNGEDVEHLVNELI